MSADTLASSSLNAFGLAGQVQPSEEQIFVLTSAQLRAIISQVVAPLETRIQDLEDEVRGGGCQVGGEDRVGSLPRGQGEQISTFRIVHNLQLENSALKSELEALQELKPWLEAISKKVARLEHGETDRPPAPGTKTAARIAAIKEVLKTRGSTTFKELERILGISSREMLRLTKKLDMRQYEIFRRQGDSREKVLRLRSQISN